MAGSADDGDDDDALRPMRAVWLSMREADAEPPSGGMAALLAAAREKADQLRDVHERPSFWQRVLATLKRLWVPPAVLALASVVVLVSGAIVLGNRHDKMSAPAHEAAPASEPTRAVERSRADDSFVAPTTGSASAAGSAASIADEIGAAPITPPTPPPPKPATTATRPKPKLGVKTETSAVEENKAAGGAGGSTSIDTKGNAQDESGSELATDAEAPTPTPPKAPTMQSTQPQDARSSPIATQLARQSESAAARGDCPTVKRTAEKLVKVDRAAHDALVARNASVARCLK